MKSFSVIVSGNQIFLVQAESEDEASEKVCNYMSEEGELRDWEVTWTQEVTEHHDTKDADIQIE